MRNVPRSPRFTNGGVSFWWHAIGRPAPGDPLPGPRDYDVCVVGGGYTGLWTAYYLKRADPSLRIAVLEREFAGFGASGRNGGWLYSGFSGLWRRYAGGRARHGMVALHRAMIATVDEVIGTAAEEGIDADVHRGGVLRVATSPAQRARLAEHHRELRRWGYGPDDIRMLDRDEREARVQVAGALAASLVPRGARIQPAKLAAGLTRTVRRLGVEVFESTPVTEIRPASGGTRATAVTPYGDVRADLVIRATEGFTAGLPGDHLRYLPMNSSMIVTEPLGPEAWRHIGWEGAELIGDEAHAYVYAQRTADGRIAIGGRGVPYRFGSRTDRRGGTRPQAVAALWRQLTRLFPAAADTPVEHTWSGVIGVPRDWCPSVHVDHASGLGWAGGYAGSGVATTNLAGRTLRDLVLRRDTELAALPWVGHQGRDWEPEPLRWLGVQVVHGLYRAADRRENEIVSRTSRYARLASLVAGR
ncbi:MAG: FAD-dependent oxidoreductase [Streptosporangiales bacterium]|nr:FAD-dependent oxidoreductase [Streptosporangiales bacterium]